MERPGRNLKSILADLRYSAERSTMFWWFVENHDAILESAGGQRIAWNTMSTRLAELGLTDRNGVCPKPHTARITWFRARKAVAAVAARPLANPSALAVPRSMPRSPFAQPLQADVDGIRETDDVPLPDFAVENSSVPGSTISLILPSTFPSRQVQTQENVIVRPAVSLPAEPVWTPEQIAHRDAVLAKARARLAYTDRFLNLRE